MAASSRTRKRPSRSKARRRPPPARRAGRRRTRAQIRRRRWIVSLVGALVAGVLIAVVVSRAGFIEETIREVTLPLRHDDIIRQEAGEEDLDPALVAAVIYAESRFVDQTSEAGARGLMQITPATARVIERRSGGVTFRVDDLADPDINISYGTYHLGYLLDRYEGREVAALAAYNAGESRVDSWGGAEVELDDIQFEETRAYVATVLEKREEYRTHYAEDLGL